MEDHSINMEKRVILKNGKELCIRPALSDDAKEIIDFINLVSTESNNITFGEGDFQMTEEKERIFIEGMQNSKNQLMIIGIIDGEIVSVSDIHGGSRQRIQHYTEIGLTVKKSNWNLGIGRFMMEYLIQWAKQTQLIRKINLQVRISNKWAIHIYQSLGFKTEGVITRGFYIDGEFCDLYMMGLEID